MAGHAGGHGPVASNPRLFVQAPLAHSAFRSPQLQPRPEPALLLASPLLLPLQAVAAVQLQPFQVPVPATTCFNGFVPQPQHAVQPHLQPYFQHQQVPQTAAFHHAGNGLMHQARSAFVASAPAPPCFELDEDAAAPRVGSALPPSRKQDHGYGAADDSDGGKFFDACFDFGSNTSVYSSSGDDDEAKEDEEDVVVPELALLQRLRQCPSHALLASRGQSPTSTVVSVVASGVGPPVSSSQEQKKQKKKGAAETSSSSPVSAFSKHSPGALQVHSPIFAAAISPRVEGKLSKYRAHMSELVAPEPALQFPAPQVIEEVAQHAGSAAAAVSMVDEHHASPLSLQALSLDDDDDDDDVGADDDDPNCSWLEEQHPVTPLPVGRMWASLGRYPTLQEHCIAHLSHLDDVRRAVSDKLEQLLAHDHAFKPVAHLMRDQVRRRFEQLHVDAAQLFLVRAQAQGAVDDRASRHGVSAAAPAFWRTPVAVAVEKRAEVAAPVVSQPIAAPAPVPSPLPMQVKFETALPPVVADSGRNVSLSSQSRGLDAEADAEVASMVHHPATPSGRHVGPMSRAEVDTMMMPPPPPLLAETVHARSVTSGSEGSAVPLSSASAASASTSASTVQRQSSEGEVRRTSSRNAASAGGAAAMNSSPSPSLSDAARRRRDEVHSCPTLSFTDKMRLLVVVTPVKEEAGRGRHGDDENEDDAMMIAPPKLGRSQSVQQRPPSSCRRRLNFDKPLHLQHQLSAAATQTAPTSSSLSPSLLSKLPRRSMTPSATSSSPYLRMLAKNAPLEEWLLHHLDDPFPTAEEKRQLSRDSGLSYDQVQHWFINARGRKLKPLLAQREAVAAAAASASAAMQTDGEGEQVGTPQVLSPMAAAAAAGEAYLDDGAGQSAQFKKSKQLHSASAQLADWAVADNGLAAATTPPPFSDIGVAQFAPTAGHPANKARKRTNKKRRHF
jgi:hypothetical protein